MNRPKIWCPACRCEVGHLLKQQDREAAQKLKLQQREIDAARKQVNKAITFLDATIAAMEAHAEEKAGEVKPVSEIYKLWSEDLLSEVRRQFPDRVQP